VFRKKHQSLPRLTDGGGSEGLRPSAVYTLALAYGGRKEVEDVTAWVELSDAGGWHGIAQDKTAASHPWTPLKGGKLRRVD